MPGVGRRSSMSPGARRRCEDVMDLQRQICTLSLMAYQELRTKSAKRIALVAHDNKKQELLEWARFNRELLAGHELYATGTTGRLLQRTLGLAVVPLQSGPLGGDQQIGSKVVEGGIDFLIFFWDPLEPQPHDPDVKALIRIAVVWHIPVACNRASADFMISSPLMASEYTRLVPDYDGERSSVVFPLGQDVSTSIGSAELDRLA